MIARAMIRMIKWYQRCISPNMRPCCRFIPSCSQYMIDAITKYGPFIGLLMGIWRIIRCNPFNKGGYDPVK